MARSSPQRFAAALDGHGASRIRRRRYFIEYETGSATVRNAQHKTATMTKIVRYSGFILGFTNIIANETYYKSHFHDDYTPVLVFVTRTAARCATIAKLTEERWRGIDVRFEVRALALAEACSEFRAQLVREAPPRSPSPQRAPAGVAAPAPQDGVLVSSRELDLLRRFQEEALQIIRRIRHTVRARQPVDAEPSYPEQTHSAAMLMQRLLQSKATKPE